MADTPGVASTDRLMSPGQEATMLPFTKRFQRCGDGARWCAVLAGATLLVMGCRSPDEGELYEVDAFYADLTVEVQGAGTVTSGVSSDDRDGRPNISCRERSGVCQLELDLDRIANSSKFFDVQLTAIPDPGWAIQGWSGACDASGTVRLDAEIPYKCIVTFNLISPPPSAPPVVAITSPSKDTTMLLSIVTLAGTATDDQKVTALGYQVNGGAEQDVFASLTASGDWTFDVAGLALGSNKIRVIARDADGQEGADSVTVTYDPTATGVACNQMVEATLATGASVDHILLIPSTDFAYSARVASVGLQGTYAFTGSGPQPIKPGEHFEQLDQIQPGTYTVQLNATTTGGIYRIYLECERPVSLNTDIAATQTVGLVQLYRFLDTRQRLHLGIHRPQVMYDLSAVIWFSGGSSPGTNLTGNPAGGYWSGFSTDSLAIVNPDFTLLMNAGFPGPSDPITIAETYTFALSTMTPPATITPGTTVAAQLGHLGQLAFYNFQGTLGDSYTLTVTHPMAGQLAAEVAVARLGAGTYHEPNFAPVATGTTTRNPLERSVVLGPFVLPATDTYIIRIGANASVSYDATLAETTGGYTVLLVKN